MGVGSHVTPGLEADAIRRYAEHLELPSSVTDTFLESADLETLTVANVQAAFHRHFALAM